MTSPLLDIPSVLAHFKDYIMRHSSPCHEVTQNDKQFWLAMDVPGMKPDNLKIDLDDGEHKVKTSREEYKFDKRFTIRKDLDTSNITARLSDGWSARSDRPEE
ncbi:hypothetical protein ACHAW5_011176 [Stephanodiscus triporus]|uniref:SHSP domain-containing protein n=1 Tax=Stephanodiscus triporus TaxID=2934178 RepID=A0ABD3PRP4_9STRA